MKLHFLFTLSLSGCSFANSAAASHSNSTTASTPTSAAPGNLRGAASSTSDGVLFAASEDPETLLESSLNHRLPNDSNGMVLFQSNTSVVQRELFDPDADGGHYFCWMNSYFRGFGYFPDKCGANEELIGAFCYDKCPNGYNRVGFDCVQKSCPSGWRDDGLFCNNGDWYRVEKLPYSVGTGCIPTPWTSCDVCGGMSYHKCKSGYRRATCNHNYVTNAWCYPEDSDTCAEAGLRGAMIFGSCAKNIILNSPKVLDCNGNDERDGIFCYPPCRSGHIGFGALCLTGVPDGWVECGLGAASSDAACAFMVGGQLYAAGSAATSVTALVGSGGASAASTAATAPGKVARLLKAIKTMVKLSPRVKKIIGTAATVLKWIGSVGLEITRAVSDGDITAAEEIRLHAMIYSIIDPTGIASVVASFAYDTCDVVNSGRRLGWLDNIQQAIEGVDAYVAESAAAAGEHKAAVSIRSNFWNTYWSAKGTSGNPYTRHVAGKEEEWTFGLDTATSKVWFKNANGKYLSARSNGSYSFVSHLQGWELFEKVPYVDGVFYLKTWRGTYIKPAGGGSGNLEQSSSIGPGERWVFEGAKAPTENVFIQSQSSGEKFLRAGKSSTSIGLTTSTGGWEQWQIYPHYDQKVSIRSYHHSFLSGYDTSTAVKQGNDEPGAHETYTIVMHDDGSVSFKSDSNHYLRMKSSGEAVMSANLGGEERFWLGRPIQGANHAGFLSSEIFTLGTHHGRYARASNDRELVATASNGGAGEAEKWRLVQPAGIGSKHVAFQSVKEGLYLSVNNDNNSYELDLTDTLDHWGWWTLTYSHDSRRVALKSLISGHFLSARTDGSFQLRTNNGGWEKFKMFPATDGKNEPWTEVPQEGGTVALRSTLTAKFLSAHTAGGAYDDRPCIVDQIVGDDERWLKDYYDNGDVGYLSITKDKYIRLDGAGRVRFGGMGPEERIIDS